MTLTPMRVSVSIESDLGRCYGTLPHGSRVLLGSLNVTPWHTLPRTVDSMSNTYNSLPSPIPLNFFTCSCCSIVDGTVGCTGSRVICAGPRMCCT